MYFYICINKSLHWFRTVVDFDLVFGTKNIEMPHEENELAEMQDQVKELPRNPSAGVKRLGERLKLYPEDSTE